MSINFYQTTRRQVLEDSTIHRKERVQNICVVVASLSKPFQSYSVDCENVDFVVIYFRYMYCVQTNKNMLRSRSTDKRISPSFVRLLHTLVDCTAKPVTTTEPDRQATHEVCSTDKLSHTVANRSPVTYILCSLFILFHFPVICYRVTSMYPCGVGDKMQHWEQD